MKPPYCFLCNIRIDDFAHDGVIYFKKTKDDLDWEKRMKEERKVEHPPYAEWFCEEHHPIAKKYSHLSWAEAIPKIKEEVEKKE